ncbi:hypothetical protein MN1_120 [Thermus phage MN1]|nr:hypothetical protein MN1_120 [Thermus phage MN1]
MEYAITTVETEDGEVWALLRSDGAWIALEVVDQLLSLSIRRPEVVEALLDLLEVLVEDAGASFIA